MLQRRHSTYRHQVWFRLDKSLRDALEKIVSAQGSKQAIELREAVREYVAKRKWMLKGD